MTETEPAVITDCVNNRMETYSDDSRVFGRDECLVTTHSVGTNNICINNCNGDSDCISSCPAEMCIAPCESSCHNYFTDPAMSDNCKWGCMISCFEFKGSTHTCPGMANCGYFGTDPVCIAEGNCQFEDVHNDCYSAFQIGCKVMGADIHSQNSEASPQDDSNSGNEASVDCPSFCRTKCIALQV